MRIYLANVGSNASHRQICSPLFEDGTFEFLPIPEGDRNLDKSRRAVHYCDLHSYNNLGDDLLRYVPEGMWGAACHNDPDLEAFTYGDDGKNARSSALKHLREGDILLFLARLERYIDGQRAGQAGFYLIGGLRVDYAGCVAPNSKEGKRFANNAHARRGDTQFFGVAGSSRSRRFKRAVPIRREICGKVFRNKDGNPWTWDGKTELARIGSYTRSIRCMLDTADPEQAQRAATLRQWVGEHSGEYGAELLAVG